MYLFYLDLHHLQDLLFVQQVARAAGGDRPPCLLVHGSGDQAERLLEGHGYFPTRHPDGRWLVETAEERQFIEQAVRATNRQVIQALNDQVVPSVGIQGGDRSLLRVEEGQVRTGRVGWVEALVSQRVLPVVSTLVPDPAVGQAAEQSAEAVLVALAEALDATVAFCLKGSAAGLLDEARQVRPTVSAAELVQEPSLPVPDVVQRVAAQGLPVLLTSVDGFFGQIVPEGTLVKT
ncbi:MAG: acetylglutamate kinase [Bacteroidota bacterium]